MKKIPMTIAALSVLFPLAAIAESPNWTFVEASYVDSSGEDSGLELDTTGYEIAGSIGFAEMFFVDLSYSSGDGDIDINNPGIIQGDLDVDYDTWTLGGGVAWGVTDTTDIYGRVAYGMSNVDVKLPGFGSESEDDDGYGAAVGVRSMVWQSLELRGELGYAGIGDGDDFTYLVGAYYTIADHFTFGASYENVGDFDTVKGTLRYQF